MPYHPDDDRLTQTSAWQNPQHWPGLDPRCAACWANGWTCETGEAQAELEREEENMRIITLSAVECRAILSALFSAWVGRYLAVMFPAPVRPLYDPPLCLCGHEETEHPLRGGCAACGCLGYDAWTREGGASV